MADLQANADVKHMQLNAVVIRADGTKEDLGAIAYHHKNPVKRLIWRLTHRAPKP